jgi:hypothetical protein
MILAGETTEDCCIRKAMEVAETFLDITGEKEEKKITYMFHGGCLGCTQQEIHGVDFCVGCQYFLPNWSLPSLSNTVNASEQKRTEIIERLKFDLGKN